MSERRRMILQPVAAIIFGAAVILVLVGLERFAQAAKGDNSTLQQAKVPTVSVPSQEQGADRRKVLAGASTDQVAEYAMQKLVPEYLTPRGTAQLLKVMPVARGQVPQLGLGCLPENVSREEPPFVLVIVKGEFTLEGTPGARGRTQTLGSRTPYQYVAMVLDVWAASPTRIVASETGGEFRQILNDTSLPVVDAHTPTNCKGWTPGTAPYGAILPGETLPVTPNDQAVEATPTTQVIPEPISTEVVAP